MKCSGFLELLEVVFCARVDFLCFIYNLFFLGKILHFGDSGQSVINN